ncbi:DUF6166 domain-containing protein [Halorubrum sp. GN11GM_10-3_MGM]|uniref:DUF6166 domain-containing protein n=1 Tax=Halorubrum sp. GN11GM_10-3_MGM TaxID=2518111 RepID=UPI001F544950|nr:DUF6166 domain-containing protein [Halorubrum sp. GN11GM_10-3_MGM]
MRHSPAEFDWGYAGRGPSQLACALFLDYTDDESVAPAILHPVPQRSSQSAGVRL